MQSLKFFYFTIQGEDLNVAVAKEEIGLECKIYIRGEISLTDYLKQEVKSKSTKWVYRDIARDEKINTFLTKNLERVVEKLFVLEPYIKKYKSYLELVIYKEDDDTPYITLTKKQIKLIEKIGVKFTVSFH